jgi:ATP-dependent Zn protease
MTSDVSSEVVAADIGELLSRSRWRGAAVAWDDIVGHEPAKRELRVVSEQIRRHSVAEQLGLTAVKGILLSGPPGSGKTLLAKALATAIDRPAYVIPAGEVDARLIRRVYETLAGESCVVIWDEADVFLRGRWGRSAPEEGRTVAAFCAALDGIDAITGPITVALTAESEPLLDPAAIRAGRLTTKVELSLPRRADRRDLWARTIALVPVQGTIDLERAADRSVGMSGADITASVMVAIGLSMVDGTDALTPPLLDEVLARRHHVVDVKRTQPDMRRTAIHEAGHAIFAVLTWGPDAVASVSAVAGLVEDGRTQLADRLGQDEDVDRARLRELAGFAYAGLVAEEIVYGAGGVSVGCSHDVSSATMTIRTLTSKLATIEAIGPLAVDSVEHGSDSDRGVTEMRSALWAAMRLESVVILDAVRRLLAPRGAEIERLAAALLSALDLTLSGPALAAVLEPVAPRASAEETGDGASRPGAPR